MLKKAPTGSRSLKTVSLESDLVVIGGGMAGTCCAITAARRGVHVTLIQDRPVLGGNASSEVRLWILGATSHMGNNNRWAREGGVIDEILTDNTRRNPEGNALIFDTILLEKVLDEANVTLLLNTALLDTHTDEDGAISSVRAFCSQNSTLYSVSAPLFCDASGDGILGFLSGAAFRMGAESQKEFGEKLAPSEEYGHLLGHSIYFYSKDAGRPVEFTPPSFALDDITEIPRYRDLAPGLNGCQLWWIEYGGRLDTVHDTEAIRWELWKIVYGVWDHIKNSGEFPEAKNLTLEWVGHIPGKRESRRFEGDYMLTQNDLVKQTTHPDAVAHGGWALDLHPADGIYSEKPGCEQWHTRGVYQIPYRSLYSRNVRNLFLAGRIISASHVAFGSTRVQATLAQAGQAVGMAAAQCLAESVDPAELAQPQRMHRLQQDLLRSGQHIPGVRNDDSRDLAKAATVLSSSTLRLAALPPDGPVLRLENSWAQLLPVGRGKTPVFTFTVDVDDPTTMVFQLRTSDRPTNHTPDVVLSERHVSLEPGRALQVSVDFSISIDEPRYVFVCCMKNPKVSVRCSERRLTGTLACENGKNLAVSNTGHQVPPNDIGVESFEFWCPRRRPEGQNLAMIIDPPLEVFEADSVTNGWNRPTNAANAWIADPNDTHPSITLKWNSHQSISEIELVFDTDFDHPMESVLMTHPETSMPFCVKHYRIRDDAGRIVAELSDNYQSLNHWDFSPPIRTQAISVELLATHGQVPASLFAIRCYGHTNTDKGFFGNERGRVKA